MRPTLWPALLLLTISLATAPAIAAETEPNGTKLETISPAPAASKNEDCPMHKNQKEKCEHKNGEPCPYHNDKKHHGKSHDKCDHKHPA